MRHIDNHIFYIENDYNKYKLEYKKQSIEQNLIRKAVKVTIQILDKGLFDNFQNSDEVFKDFFFTTGRKPDLSEQVNDDIQ